MLTPTPGPTDESGNAVTGDEQTGDENWVRPTMPPMDGWGIEATVEPMQTIAPVNQAIPEDAWANQ